MTNDWKPNAPDLKAEFQGQPKQRPTEADRPAPPSKIELQMLEAQRDEPMPGLNLTIGGEIKTAVHEQLAVKREERIRTIKARLQAQKDVARQAFDKGR